MTFRLRLLSSLTRYDVNRLYRSGVLTSTHPSMNSVSIAPALVRAFQISLFSTSTYHSNFDGDDSEFYYAESDIKDGILEAALEYVPTHGWTREAIVKAAEKYGYPGVAHGMFPGGGADLANYFYARCNAELRQQLKAKSEEGVPKVSVFVRDAVEQRIRLTLPHRDTWPQAMAELGSPSGAKGAMNNLQKLVDDIWFYAGDRSVDFSWYTKRALLACVYKSTEFYMLQDESEGNVETWAFLDRRINGAAWLGQTVREQKEVIASCAGSLKSNAVTLVNASGLSSK